MPRLILALLCAFSRAEPPGAILLILPLATKPYERVPTKGAPRFLSSYSSSLKKTAWDYTRAPAGLGNPQTVKLRLARTSGQSAGFAAPS